MGSGWPRPACLRPAGVEAGQLAADFAEAAPEIIRLQHLDRPAKGCEQAYRRLVRWKIEDDRVAARPLDYLITDQARERS